MKKILTIISILLISFNGISDNYTDSLINILNKSDDFQKSDIYLKLLEATNSDSIKLLLNYSDKAVQYAKLSKSDSALAVLFNEIGLTFYSKSNYTLAEKYFLFSLDKEIELNNFMNIAKMYSNIAVINDLKGDYEKAIEKYLQALEYFENENYKKGIAFVYNNLGVVYDEMNRKDEALKFKLKSLKIKTEIGDSVGMASTLNNLGVVYEEKFQNYDSAFYYYENALNLYLKLNQRVNYAITLQNIAALNKLSGNSEKSLKEYSEALDIFKEESNLQGQAYSYRNIGEILIEIKKFAEAVENLNKGLNISIQIDDRKTKLEIIGLFADLYYKSGDFKKSADFYQQYNFLNDSLINSENQNQINELKTKYETTQLEFQIEILDKENQLKAEKLRKNNYILSALAVFVVFMLVLFYFLRKISKLNSETQKSILEQKVLRLQMNPHFISNALTSIQNFLYQNKPQEAANYLSDFSRLMRQTIKSTSNEFVTLEEEIQSLKDFVKIQQLRYPDLFDFEVHISDKIETDFVEIPPMILQPFIENSIKHAFKNLDYRGLIRIEIIEENKNLLVEIIDNGKGIEHEKSENHISYSMKITEERLKNIGKIQKKNSFIKIFNKFENGKGLKIILQIPIN